MTWKQKYAQNIKLIGLYINSIKHEDLSNNQCVKLATEIGRLANQTQRIKNMYVEDFHKEAHVSNLTETSIINASK